MSSVVKKSDPLLGDIDTLISSKVPTKDAVDVSEEIQYLESLKVKKNKKQQEKRKLKLRLTEAEKMNRKLREILDKYGIDCTADHAKKPKGIVFDSIGNLSTTTTSSTSVQTSESSPMKSTIEKCSEIHIIDTPAKQMDEKTQTYECSKSPAQNQNSYHFTETQTLFSHDTNAQQGENRHTERSDLTQIHLSSQNNISKDISHENAHEETQEIAEERSVKDISYTESQNLSNESLNTIHNRTKYISERAQQIIDQLNNQIKKSSCCPKNRLNSKCSCNSNKTNTYSNYSYSYKSSNDNSQNSSQSTNPEKSKNKENQLNVVKNQRDNKNLMNKNVPIRNHIRFSLNDKNGKISFNSKDESHNIKAINEEINECEEEVSEIVISSDYSSDYDDEEEEEMLMSKADQYTTLKNNLTIIDGCLIGTTERENIMDYLKRTQSDYLSRQTKFGWSDACRMIEVAARHMMHYKKPN